MGKNEAANISMTPPLAAAKWQKGEERNILKGKLIEPSYVEDDINDETFDFGYDLHIHTDTENERNSQSSDLDIQIEGLTLQEFNKAESLTGKNCNIITL